MDRICVIARRNSEQEKNGIACMPFVFCHPCVQCVFYNNFKILLNGNYEQIFLRAFVEYTICDSIFESAFVFWRFAQNRKSCFFPLNWCVYLCTFFVFSVLNFLEFVFCVLEKQLQRVHLYISIHFCIHIHWNRLINIRKVNEPKPKMQHSLTHSMYSVIFFHELRFFFVNEQARNQWKNHFFVFVFLSKKIKIPVEIHVHIQHMFLTRIFHIEKKTIFLHFINTFF